jgi:hypothetical protein
MMMALKGDRMHPRWSQGTGIPRGTVVSRCTVVPWGTVVSRWRAPFRLTALAAVIVATAVGCGHSAATASHPAMRCGTARTVANVPVKVEVTRGQVACSEAMTVERAYTSAIAQGKAPGNGGGGPLDVSGWKCQGFPTPVVLKTGWASKCVRGGTEILAILPPPSSS